MTAAADVLDPRGRGGWVGSVAAIGGAGCDTLAAPRLAPPAIADAVRVDVALGAAPLGDRAGAVAEGAAPTVCPAAALIAASTAAAAAACDVAPRAGAGAAPAVPGACGTGRAGVGVRPPAAASLGVGEGGGDLDTCDAGDGDRATGVLDAAAGRPPLVPPDCLSGPALPPRMTWGGAGARSARVVAIHASYSRSSSAHAEWPPRSANWTGVPPSLAEVTSAAMLVPNSSSSAWMQPMPAATCTR